MASPRSSSLPSLISLLEEGTHLLRRCPAGAWLVYYAFSLPFAVFLFFFVNDMAQSARALARLQEASLLLALLYGVMKIGQALYCDRLMALVEGRDQDAGLGFKGWLRLVASQFLVHSTAPWVLVISVLALVPLPWTYAFYHNFTILAVNHFRRGGTTRGLIAQSAKQSHLDWQQNSLTVVALKVVAVFVYLNLFVGFAAGASLLKSVTGVENPFSMTPGLLFGTAVQGLLLIICYLGMNPLVKSLYVLRCFYGDSRTSGADLLVRLRRLTAGRKEAALFLTLVLLLPAWGSLHAQTEGPPSVPVAEVKGEQLSQNIKDVLQGSDYQWRMPRSDNLAEEDTSWLGTSIRAFGSWIGDIFDDLGNIVGDIIDWLSGRRKEGEDPVPAGQGMAWAAMMPRLLVILGVVLVVALIIVLFRNWRQSRQVEIAGVEEAPPEINLESEDVVATQLPENEWLRLAREKMEAGELRLALRALFLATLAHLGEKRLLQINATKSNGDYVREMARRVRGGNEALHDSFLHQVRTFDRVWYGWHEVNDDVMTRFKEEHERITRHAA